MSVSDRAYLCVRFSLVCACVCLCVCMCECVRVYVLRIRLGCLIYLLKAFMLCMYTKTKLFFQIEEVGFRTWQDCSEPLAKGGAHGENETRGGGGSFR